MKKKYYLLWGSGLRLVIALAVLLMFATPLAAIGKLSFDWQRVDIHEVFKRISEVSGKNVVLDGNIQCRVTLKMENATWQEALEAVLAAEQLVVEESGNVLIIHKMDSWSPPQAAPTDGQFSELVSRQIFTPRFMTVKDLKAKFERLKSVRGVVLEAEDGLYAEDSSERLLEMNRVFMEFDQPKKPLKRR